MSAIVLWSAAGGLLLGAIADALLVGAAVCFGAFAPAVVGRLGTRVGLSIGLALLLLIPVISATLGFLEGKLKTT